jgi:hypothetical protein
MDKNNLKNTIPEPSKPTALPNHAHWLAGEGAGSWFVLEKAESNKILVTRYSPSGKVECQGFFECRHNTSFNLEETYQLTHLSHCKQVSLIQNGQIIKLNRIN